MQELRQAKHSHITCLTTHHKYHRALPRTASHHASCHLCSRLARCWWRRGRRYRSTSWRFHGGRVVLWLLSCADRWCSSHWHGNLFTKDGLQQCIQQLLCSCPRHAILGPGTPTASIRQDYTACAGLYLTDTGAVMASLHCYTCRATREFCMLMQPLQAC